MGGDGALAQDPFVGGDVVVNRVEGIRAGEPGALHQDLCHQLAVAAGKALADLYVMEIIVKIIRTPKPIMGEIAATKKMKNQNFLNNLLMCKKTLFIVVVI